MRKLILYLAIAILISTKCYAPDFIKTKPLNKEEVELIYNYIDIKNEVENKLNFEFYNIMDIPYTSPIESSKIKRISSLFGVREVHPILRIRTFHNGIDFSANYNTEILATGNGKVEKVKYSRFGYGNYIEIKHILGFKTKYAHLNKINVKEGQIVKQGDLIGYVGNTGLSTGPHLHYEIIYNNKNIDPLELYNIKIGLDKGKEYISKLYIIEKYLKKYN